MTDNNQPADSVEVTQADRDAAAEFHAWFTAQPGTEGCDLGEAFARHRLSAQPAREDALREAAAVLEQAEAYYRKMHDHYGTGDSRTGRAWDIMRRAGDRVLVLLSHPSQAPAGNGGDA